jgi:hypothetical protein
MVNINSVKKKKKKENLPRLEAYIKKKLNKKGKKQKYICIYIYRVMQYTLLLLYFADVVLIVSFWIFFFFFKTMADIKAH